MRRTPIRRVGKIGKRNIEANKEIADMWMELGVTACEVRLNENCQGMNLLTNMHRHKRVWYRSCPEKLHDYRHVVRACMYCHQKCEYDKLLTERIFLALRGREDAEGPELML